ncbi:MAG: DsrE family protein [Thermodesulfovibrionales bacterium]
MAKLNVLFHINEEDRFEVLLLNITNSLKDAGKEKGDIAVLTNGPSVKAYTDIEMIREMKELSGKGVQFLACRNAINEMCSEWACIEEDNCQHLTIVPVGITEVIRKQRDGYAYVKP